MHDVPDATATARPTINMLGQRVALGPFTPDLLEIDMRWINDLETQRNLTIIPRPRTLEQQRAYHEQVESDASTLMFVIYIAGTWQPIGTTALKNIEHHNRSAEFGLMIGEPTARGKGYGTETTRLMLDYAFTALGLHNVLLQVLESNIAGLRAYTKAGFREIGRRSGSVFASGRYWDTIYMECLASEFESPLLSQVFVPDAPR